MLFLVTFSFKRMRFLLERTAFFVLIFVVIIMVGLSSSS